jgi:hypothetical protein
MSTWHYDSSAHALLPYVLCSTALQLLLPQLLLLLLPPQLAHSSKQISHHLSSGCSLSRL